MSQHHPRSPHNYDATALQTPPHATRHIPRAGIPPPDAAPSSPPNAALLELGVEELGKGCCCTLKHYRPYAAALAYAVSLKTGSEQLIVSHDSCFRARWLRLNVEGKLARKEPGSRSGGWR
ncbi:hypothetical protein E2C01_065439 [Portunus trituberculatus]|uniref:Uncharacterized protein n=1 Tax=Portunus trituberculatus TaxID=210409 RepID=A0A5B7HN55_PORTR|nr:hypothetical protein [Portunus trituberculatus]